MEHLGEERMPSSWANFPLPGNSETLALTERYQDISAGISQSLENLLKQTNKQQQYSPPTPCPDLKAMFVLCLCIDWSGTWINLFLHRHGKGVKKSVSRASQRESQLVAFDSTACPFRITQPLLGEFWAMREVCRSLTTFK